VLRRSGLAGKAASCGEGFLKQAPRFPA